MIERQQSFADLESAGQRRRSRREEFLEAMDAIAPWAEWVALVEPPYPDGRRGRRPFGCERMLRMYLLQVWFHLSDAGCEDAVLASLVPDLGDGVRMYSCTELAAMPELYQEADRILIVKAAFGSGLPPQ